MAANFKGRKTQKRLGGIESLLETLVALGQARLVDDEVVDDEVVDDEVVDDEVVDDEVVDDEVRSVRFGVV